MIGLIFRPDHVFDSGGGVPYIPRGRDGRVGVFLLYFLEIVVVCSVWTFALSVFFLFSVVWPHAGSRLLRSVGAKKARGKPGDRATYIGVYEGIILEYLLRIAALWDLVHVGCWSTFRFRV